MKLNIPKTVTNDSKPLRSVAFQAPVIDKQDELLRNDRLDSEMLTERFTVK